MQQYKIETPIGALYLIATDEVVHGLYFRRAKAPMVDSPNRMHKKMIAQLNEYFKGKRTEFDLPLHFAGSEFQAKIWNELRKIPYGETISYTELATRVKNPKAVRAAGSANGKNPISIIIPCHRVIAANGTLGGYAGGLERKTQLLGIEKTKKA